MPAFRVVLDTNVVLASQRTASPTSPNREVLDRWKRGEYTLLYADDALLEYGEKLFEHGFSDEEVRAFLEGVQALGEPVNIEYFHLPRYPSDSDDIAFVLCALNGAATHPGQLRPSLICRRARVSLRHMHPSAVPNANPSRMMASIGLCESRADRRCLQLGLALPTPLPPPAHTPEVSPFLESDGGGIPDATELEDPAATTRMQRFYRFVVILP